MKKAMVNTLLLTIIIGLITTGLGTVLISKMDDGTCKLYDKSMCKHSVAWNSYGRTPIIEKEKFPIKCPTRFIIFHEKTIEEEWTGCHTKEKLDCPFSGERWQQCILQKANEVIAKRIYDCWDQFAMGRIKVLDTYAGGDRQCVICTTFQFSPEVIEKFEDIGSSPISTTKFRNDLNPDKDYTLDNYMRKTAAPQPHQGITIYQLSLDPLDTYKLPVYDYTMTDIYAIVFKAMNEDQIKAQGTALWNHIKSNRLTIPWTDVNVNPFSSDDEVKDPQEFINIMDLIKLDEVAGSCDSLD